MQFVDLNGLKTYSPRSPIQLMDFAFKNPGILIAVNAEKILHADNNFRNLINRNLGYPDGIGAVMALKQKGVSDVIKIPGCELWLDIIKTYFKKKTFYLVGGRQEVIEETVNKLH